MLAATAPATIAQDDGFYLEEVVVTARKREENLQETPLAITALSAEALQRRQIVGTDDLDKVAPNIQFASHGPLTGNSSASQVFIRGIGQTDATSSVDPGVGLYIDEVYMGSSVGGSMDFRDIANIQVVRGPQGTLFGRNTIGGAVVITTGMPGEDFGGTIKLGAGNQGLMEINAAVDVPISESLKTRFTYGARERDGYVEQLSSGLDLGDESTYTLTAKALWQASDRVDLTFKFDYTEEDENGVPYVFADISETAAFPAALSANAGCPGASFPPPFIPDGVVDGLNCVNSATFSAGEFANNGSVIPRSTLENSGFAAIANVDLSDQFSLKYIGSYRETNWTGVRDADNTPYVILHTSMNSDSEQSSHEIQINFEGDAFKSVLGLFYFQTEADEDLSVNFTPPEGVIIPVSNDAILTTESSAIFGQITYELTERLQFTAGIRYTDETKEAFLDQFSSAPAGLEDGAGPLLSPAPDANGQGITEVYEPIIAATRYVLLENNVIEFDDTSGHLNLAYQFDTASVYASFSQAFKSGGWNPLYNAVQPLSDSEVGDTQSGPGNPTSFAPETAETWELGFKWDPSDSFRLNGALFTTSYQDLQITNRVGIVPLLFNAGEAGIDGVELEFAYTPSASWIVEGSLGLLDGTIDEPVDITTRTVVDGVVTEVVATQTVQRGNATPYSPEATANVGVSYIFGVGDWSVIPRLDANYVGSQFFDAGNTPEIAQLDSQLTARFALTLEDDSGDWRIVAGIENLTDETYPVAGNSSLATATGYAEIVYNRPRTYYLNVEYSF
ncbi:MAG: TonB-dependent receptor [Cellvibrionaceae bacterium]|nr:TonB-dependent receptor [Cellvibrionaceae bacterium]